MRPLWVYGIGAGSLRQIVAVRTQVEVTRVFEAIVGPGYSHRYLKEYGSETGNREEITLAMSDPGQIYTKPNNYLFNPVWTRTSDKKQFIVENGKVLQVTEKA